ncbi:unnamed protein product [Gongylonema pulchrum]|uniref:Structural maintenance of chromosomes protein 4 n=1 Tax=Gongylonema pulchrum TaxID=637853 RepID=A0A183DU51_9BILA|nr:unnamed protein product [Gongylonema pulchrum]
MRLEIDVARDKASEKADKARERVAEINAKIQEVYEQVVGPFQKELDEVQAKKESASKGATKEQSALNNAQRNMNKALSRKNDLEMDHRETEEAIKRIEEAEDCQEEDSNRLTKELIQQEKSMKEAEGKVKEALSKNSELDAEEVELKKKCADLTRALAEQLKFLEHKKGKLAAIEGKLESLCLCYVKCLDRLPESLQSTEDEEDDDFALQEASQVEHDFFKKLKKRKVGKVLNTNGLLEYLTKLERYDREVEALSEISTKRDKHRQFCEQLKKQRMNEFMEGFTRIGVALKEMYQMITLGGDASLDLVDSLDPFSEGVSFGVRPPKKSWKQITNLSGGEKTLSSLALVFALHHYRPTPLYVMDEIDAALDFRNVSIIGHYIKDRTKNAQFIVISLRNNMFELADRLVGIYKTFDCTKSVAIDPVLADSIIKPFLLLEEMKNRKGRDGSKTTAADKKPFNQLQNKGSSGDDSPFMQMLKKKPAPKPTSLTIGDTEGNQLSVDQDSECGVALEKRKRAGSSARITQGSETIDSYETPSPIDSPPSKKKSQSSELPAWDVPQAITVRPARCSTTEVM